MDATSEIESQGRESKMDTDAATVPAEFTEQFFDELQAKCLAVSLTSFRARSMFFIFRTRIRRPWRASSRSTMRQPSITCTQFWVCVSSCEQTPTGTRKIAVECRVNTTNYSSASTKWRKRWQTTETQWTSNDSKLVRIIDIFILALSTTRIVHEPNWNKYIQSIGMLWFFFLHGTLPEHYFVYSFCFFSKHNVLPLHSSFHRIIARTQTVDA